MMMKNSKYSIIAVVALLLIAGCKKRNDADKPPGTKTPCANTVGTYSGAVKLDSSTLFYDELRRLNKITTQGDADYSYSYEQDKIKITYSGILYQEITLSNGLAAKVAEVGKSNYQVLTYNAEGYLATVADYANNVLQQTVRLSYTNGNLTAVKTTFANSSDDKNGTVEYSSDVSSARLTQINVLNELVRYAPVEYLGKLSKNAVTKYSIIILSGTRRTENVRTYTYIKDGAGKFTAASEVYYTKTYNNGQLTGSAGGTFDYRFNFGCD
jgi:hypothetical protein